MKTALVIIDIQNDYFPGGANELFGAEAAGKQAGRLLTACRSVGRPVFHVRHVATHAGATFFLPDTPGADVHASVAPLPSEPVIVKRHPSSFRGTDLYDRLRAAGIDRLLIAGMMTHMCVDTTVRAAADLGFDCLLAHDACATKTLTFGGLTVPAPQVQASYLAALDGTFAEVLSTEESLARVNAG